jgi:hypothetical protein
MSTIPAIPQNTNNSLNQTGRALFVWTGLNSSNLDGESIGCGFANISITLLASGTWNGATCTIQGSFDAVNWFPLSKINGDPAALTADAIISLGDLPLYIRPLVSSAGGSTNLTVKVFIK